MFETLRAALHQEHENKKAAAREYIQHGYMKTWAAEHQKESDEGIKRHSTAARWDAYQAGKISREKAVELATARRIKELEKELAQNMQQLDAAEAAPDVKGIAIHVEWKRSATWGYNPHASVIVNQVNRYEGSASGCGYDKRTAAIAEAANQSAVLLRMLYSLKEKALQTGEKMPYGAGYGVLPYFEGGVGMESFYGVFNACGMNVTERDERGKYYDFYYVEKAPTQAVKPGNLNPANKL